MKKAVLLTTLLLALSPAVHAQNCGDANEGVAVPIVDAMDAQVGTATINNDECDLFISGFAEPGVTFVEANASVAIGSTPPGDPSSYPYSATFEVPVPDFMIAVPLSSLPFEPEEEGECGEVAIALHVLVPGDELPPIEPCEDHGDSDSGDSDSGDSDSGDSDSGDSDSGSDSDSKSGHSRSGKKDWRFVSAGQDLTAPSFKNGTTRGGYSRDSDSDSGDSDSGDSDSGDSDSGDSDSGDSDSGSDSDSDSGDSDSDSGPSIPCSEDDSDSGDSDSGSDSDSGDSDSGSDSDSRDSDSGSDSDSDSGDSDSGGSDGGSTTGGGAGQPNPAWALGEIVLANGGYELRYVVQCSGGTTTG